MGSLPPIPQVPEAVWIWGSTNNVITCLQNDTFQHNFTMRCPGTPMTLYAQAAQMYNFTLLGQTGGAQNKTYIQNYTISTQGTTCGNG